MLRWQAQQGKGWAVGARTCATHGCTGHVRRRTAAPLQPFVPCGLRGATSVPCALLCRARRARRRSTRTACSARPGATRAPRALAPPGLATTALTTSSCRGWASSSMCALRAALVVLRCEATHCGARGGPALCPLTPTLGLSAAGHAARLVSDHVPHPGCCELVDVAPALHTRKCPPAGPAAQEHNMLHAALCMAGLPVGRGRCMGMHC